MRIVSMLAVTLALFAASAPSAALEPFKIYDRFSDPAIDPQRWFEAERTREIKAGALHLRQKNWGRADLDVGSEYFNWADSFTGGLNVTAMQARITVSAIEVPACATNTNVTDARARLVGTFFNVGTPTPGSYVGDAFVQVRLFRNSTSADPAGTMRVGGILQICTSSDCNAASLVGNIVDLGTATLGTPVTVSVQWDRPSKTFYFARDNGAYSGTVAYAESDVSAPGVLLRQIATRMSVPNCMTGGRVGALIDAKFDNVYVNQSAAP